MKPFTGVLVTGLAAAMLMAGCSARTIDFPHVHGLGYTADGAQLTVAAHDGLRVYSAQGWVAPDVPRHDYMGFAPSSDGFYSSGHPAQGSGLSNPLGLAKSTDGGKTLKTLAFAGESDFHIMGVGYQNHAVYVLNPAPNTRLQAGLHYSLDDGRTWQGAEAKGAAGRPLALAVHPTRAAAVALATDQGLFLSSDHGNRFEQVTGGPVSAVAYSPAGDRLLYGAAQLFEVALADMSQRTWPGPAPGGDDFIVYIAVNPARPEEVAVATGRRVNLYLSPDKGRSWTQIVSNGKGEGRR